MWRTSTWYFNFASREFSADDYSGIDQGDHPESQDYRARRGYQLCRFGNRRTDPTYHPG